MAKKKKEMIAPIGRYIDPLTDFGFKKIFNSEPNKDLLIAFLNELFKGRKVIKDLIYNTQENSGPVKHYRKTIFDLTCTGADGEPLLLKCSGQSRSILLTGRFFILQGSCMSKGLKAKRTGIINCRKYILSA